MVVPLAGLSVVDAGDDATALLGRMLSDLGATVRLVGPKDPIGEALNDVDSYRGAFAVGKSTLERVELLRACHDADVVLAGNLAKFPELGAASDWPSRFPGTILVSITPFGTSGPMSHRASSDLVNMAMSGYLNMTGPEGGPPLKPSAPLLSWRHACNHALVGLLLAIRQRRLTGQATHVDVAARDTGLWMLTHTYQYWDMEQINL
ncbi:MAG: CoA transferase, partial [Tepidiformaceae bacterium]